MTDQVFSQLCDHVRETAMLEAINSLLELGRTHLLARAGGRVSGRADHDAVRDDPSASDRSALARLVGSIVGSSGDAGTSQRCGTIIRQVRREYDKQSKLPPRLVEELARYSVIGQQVWVEARKQSDFGQLAPYLEKIVALKQEQAEAIGYDGVPYDALLDDYEPDAKTADVERALADLRGELVPLVQAIADSGRTAPVALLKAHYPRALQEQFGKAAATALGFDFHRGRLDVTDHPFCTEMGPHDCRITTRYDESFFPSAFFGILHEAGHGMYEQGRRPDQYGLPTGQYVSLGIHESQSRLWENQVGRSRAFWQHFFPQAQQQFGAALAQVSFDDFYFAINDVRPSLIRVEADEATYNLHIVIRFELEQLLVSKQLQVAESAGGVEREVSTVPRHHVRRRPPRVCCRTSTGPRH